MFTWDASKAIANFEKHGISFEEGATVFGDPDGLEWEDTEHSKGESRLKRLGRSAAGRILLVVTRSGGQEMARKRFGSSVPASRAAKSAGHMPDSRIDFSDIPESTGEELSRARRVGRPRTGRTKRLIAIRIDPGLLARLRRMARKHGKPYQTFIHDLLDKATKRVA